MYMKSLPSLELAAWRRASNGGLDVFRVEAPLFKQDHDGGYRWMENLEIPVIVKIKEQEGPKQLKEWRSKILVYEWIDR